jgi:small subunit ribosomal protein S5
MSDETAGGPPADATGSEQQRPRGPRRGGPGGGRGPGGPGGGRGPGGGPGGNRGPRRDDRNRNAGPEERADGELVDKLVAINRVAKVVKGGKNFAFAALVVVGDKKGRVGFGHGKAREVPEAIRKATEEAKKTMIRVPLREGRTLHHDGDGRWGAGKVMLRAAPAGKGLIAGGPMRAVLEVLGVSDVVAKSKGSSNPYNMVRATIDALKNQTSPRQVANRRGLKVSDLVARRKDGASLGDVPAEG